MARESRTEYGGVSGNPNRFPDGTDIDLSPREAARVLRMVGHAVGTGNVNLDAPDEVEVPLLANGEESVVEREKALKVQAFRVERRRRLTAATNGYADTVPNNPVYNKPVS